MDKTKRPEVLLCDLDGVVWLAHVPIAGSVEAIARIRDRGTRVLFVTNNSFSTLDQQVEALERIGVPARGDVVTSAMSVRTQIRPGSRVLVCGGDGLIEEVGRAGAEAVVAYRSRAAEGPFDAVVVGFHREFDYEVLSDALTAVRLGARLIGSNEDPTYPTPNGPIPGGGSILAAIAKAAGVRPMVTGKPHQPMAHLVRDMCPGVESHEMVMVGDRPDTDGAFARTVGCRFALVMSGVTSGANGTDADLVAPTLSGIIDLLADGSDSD